MEVKVKGIYKHFKGDYYIVEDIAYNSETLEKMVVYRGLYEGGRLWVRPYDNFIEKVNESQCRFELQNFQSKR